VTTLAELVANMQLGDYVEAEFRELSPPRWHGDRMEIGRPTGRLYALSGELGESNSILYPNEQGLYMPNGQCVRQFEGSPGGNLVRIIKHVPKETAA